MGDVGVETARGAAMRVKADARNIACHQGLVLERGASAARVLYRADGDVACGWKPAIHMPRALARILLEVTAVRVERLQDISEEQAKAEGAPMELGELERTVLGAVATYRAGFARLWRSINGAESWDANPWVWVVEFKRVTP